MKKAAANLALISMSLIFGSVTCNCDASEESIKNGKTSIRLEEVFRIENRFPVVSVDFSPDGILLAAAMYIPGENPDTVKLWDVRTGKEVANLKGHLAWVNDLKFSPDGRLLGSASRDKTVKLWNVGMRTEATTLRGHDGDVCCLAFSPDGKQLVTGSSDWTVKLWDLSTGKIVRTITKHRPSPRYLQFSRDGTKLLTAGSDGRVIIWDTKTYEPYVSLPVGAFAVAALSSDGQILAIDQQGGISLSEIDSTQPDVVIETGRRGINSGVSSLAFASRKTIGFGYGDGWLGIANAQTGKILLSAKKHRRVINDLAFSPTGDLVATACDDGDLCLFRPHISSTPHIKTEPEVFR